MDTHALWIAASVGIACLLAGFGLSRTAGGSLKSSVSAPFLLAAVLLPLAVFLVTLPSHGRLFAPGHDLGNGALLGGLGALLAANAVAPLWKQGKDPLSSTAKTACVAASLGAAVVAICAEATLKHDTDYIAMLAVAVGWILVSALLLMGVHRAEASKPAEWSVYLVVPTAYCATASAAIVLAGLRSSAHQMHNGTLSAASVLLLFAAAVPVSLLVSALFRLLISGKGAAARWMVRAQYASGIVAFVAAVRYADRYAPALSHDSVHESRGLEHLFAAATSGSHLLQASIVGITATLLCSWLSPSASSGTDAASQDGGKSTLALMAVLASSLLAYQLLAGFGVTLAALAGFLPLGLLLVNSGDGQTITRSVQAPVAIACAATGMGLYRLFFSLYDGNFPLSPYTDQYAVFGLTAGIALPLVLSQIGYGSARSSSNSASGLSLICAGLVSVLVPCALLVLWGNRCTIAFIAASSISSALLLALRSGGVQPDNGLMQSACTLFGSLAIPVFMCEWAHYALSNPLYTRESKEHFAIGLAIILAVVILLQAVIRAVNEARSATEQGAAIK
jgi:hypothetical protein